MTATVSQAYLPYSGRAYTRRYSDVRARSESLVAPLSPEDQQVPLMPDASPTHDGVLTYQAHVDAAMADFFDTAAADTLEDMCYLLELGLHHEQQHQELILMDIKHAFSRNPFGPSYRRKDPAAVFGTHAL